MKNKRIKNICIAILCIILFVYLAICVNSIMNKNKIGFFSYRFYIMSSDSTEAGIHTGDLVIAKSIDVKNFKENDNIIYERNGEMIVKKIIRVEKNSKKANIYIENDNLIINEKQKDARVEGKIVHVIRGFGNVALFIQSPIGTLDVLAIAVCIFIIIKKIGRETSQNDGASEKETV